jgi:cell shape-determining protein MreC
MKDEELRNRIIELEEENDKLRELCGHWTMEKEPKKEEDLK